MTRDPGKRTAPACATRAVLNRVGDQWSFLIIWMLEGGTLRFGELKKKVDGISPRVLTQTLRSLEQDGLVTRHAFATIPPRVDYAITELGRSLAEAMKPLILWAKTNQATVEAHRRGLGEEEAAEALDDRLSRTGRHMVSPEGLEPSTP